MISRKNLDTLIEDHKKALQLVNQAVNTLEGVLPLAGGVSAEFARHSDMLIRDTNMVYRFINSSLSRLHKTTPDD